MQISKYLFGKTNLKGHRDPGIDEGGSGGAEDIQNLEFKLYSNCLLLWVEIHHFILFSAKCHIQVEPRILLNSA